MKYSKSRLALQTTKEIAKDAGNLSKKIANRTSNLLKEYADSCYKIYLGNAHLFDEGDGKNDDILKERNLNFNRYLLTYALNSAAPFVTGVSGALIFDSADASMYGSLASVVVLLEPGAKSVARRTCQIGKNYVQKKINLAQKNLDTSI